jgi:2-polyprenyl-3-methyl-5-hydroxy-6-metoxy-1,4-benzoquinol methylase
VTALSPDNDPSNGWEAVAAQLIQRRDQSRIGVDIVRAWTKSLNRGTSILDLGCGSGVPVSQALIDDGFIVTGIDASPTLVATFRSRFPGINIACEQAETSRFFGKTYDAVIAIGLMFLLSEAAQKTLIVKVGSALNVGGRFLFTSPSQSCIWNDLMTGRQSRSLGAAAYAAILSESGLTLIGEHTDEGQNHYYEAIRQ